MPKWLTVKILIPQGYPLYRIYLENRFFAEPGWPGKRVSNRKYWGSLNRKLLFSVSFPGLTPPQVRKALEAISETAFLSAF